LFIKKCKLSKIGTGTKKEDDMAATSTQYLTQGLRLQLEAIREKNIDDQQIFELTQDGTLHLTAKVQTYWGKFLEISARLFTNKMPLLRAKFAEITTSLEDYLEKEQDATQRNQVLERYGTAINEIYRCAARMRANEISGFEAQLVVGPRTHQYLVVSPAYQLRTHLPKEMYDFLRQRNLLAQADSQKRLSKNMPEGNAIFTISLYNLENMVQNKFFTEDSATLTHCTYMPGNNEELRTREHFIFDNRRLMGTGMSVARLYAGGWCNSVTTDKEELQKFQAGSLTKRVLEYLAKFASEPTDPV
jgi:hypothetical protein